MGYLFQWRNLGFTTAICLLRSDPKHFQSQYDGTKAATSRVAALKFVYHESERLSFELSPRISLSWCQPFTTLAIRVNSTTLLRPISW